MTIRIMLALLAASVSAIAISACGSSAKPKAVQQPAAATHTTSTAPSGGAASLPMKYSECMRSHGEPKFPNPVDGHITLSPSSNINPNSAEYEKANKACARYGPSGSVAGSGASAETATGGGDTNAPAATSASWDHFADWLKQQTVVGQFSGSVLVAHGANTVLDDGYGYADRTTKTVNSTATRYCVASIGKLFTAVAIGQLVEHHELSFEATVGKYVIGLPARIANRVTIGELLDMTSGLGNVVLSQANPPHTLAEMVALIAKESPQSTPGAKFDYSNDGYILLGAVVQHVSGESYIAYVRQHIFDVAGMTGVGYSTYIPADVAGMAHGYAQDGPKLNDIGGEPQIANPSGGAYTTTGGLLKFARALLEHKLLTATMTATVLKPRVNSPQPGGPPIDKYTYGFAYQQINGITFIGHNGGTPGYSGQIDIYPRTGYVVVILTNQDNTLVPAIQRSETILTNS